MTSPIQQLSLALKNRTPPPFDWIVEHGGDGTIDAAWNSEPLAVEPSAGAMLAVIACVPHGRAERLVVAVRAVVLAYARRFGVHGQRITEETRRVFDEAQATGFAYGPNGKTYYGLLKRLQAVVMYDADVFYGAYYILNVPGWYAAHELVRNVSKHHSEYDREVAGEIAAATSPPTISEIMMSVEER